MTERIHLTRCPGTRRERSFTRKEERNMGEREQQTVERNEGREKKIKKERRERNEGEESKERP